MKEYIEYSKDQLLQLVDSLEKEVDVLNQKLTAKNLLQHPSMKHPTNSKLLLHDLDNGYEFLMKTCDTLFLIQQDGTCIDLIVKANHWLIRENKILGKNVFDLLPVETRVKIKYEFDKVIKDKTISNNNYELPLKWHVFYFKCIIQLLDNGLVLCQYRDITQRVQIKKRLEIANIRLKETGKVAKISQWTYNCDTDVIHYYGNVEGLNKGYTESSMMLSDYYKYVHPDDLSMLKHYMMGEQGDVHFYDYRLILDGEISYFRIKIIRIREAAGNKIIEGYIQNTSDIIKKRNEFEMVTNAVNKSNDIIFGARADGTFIFANDLCRKYRGIPIDATISDYVIPNQASQTAYPKKWSDIVEAVMCKAPYKYMIEQLTDNMGRKLYFDCTSYIIKDEFGQDTIWCFWKNITKQAEAEKQTRTTGRLLQTILDNIPALICVKDSGSDFKNIYINKAAHNSPMLREKSDPINKTDFELYPPSIAKAHRNEDVQILISKKNLRNIKEYIQEDGSIRTMDKLKLMIPKDEDNSALIIDIEWDISDMKKIEEELIKAKEKAEQSDKLKSAFLSNMSHEIRTPLNAIVGFSRIIADINDKDERHKYYEIIESNNVRLLSLINEILDLSKIESGMIEFTTQTFDLNGLLNELYANLSLLGLNNNKLIVKIPVQNVMISTDRNRLYQVISNLITNAQKFTKEGEIEFGAMQEDNRINFYVKDTGMGIPADKLATVFDRFIKINSNIQGTGLGLAICKTIVEKLGGEISVTSTFGQGTCFTFFIPYTCATVSECSKGQQVKSIRIKEFDKQRILIIENDETDLKLLKLMLHDDYNLLSTSKYEHLDGIISEFEPHVILIGIQEISSNIVNNIKAIDSNIPIIALSSYAFKEDREKAEKCGFDQFLIKPVSKEVLIKTIEDYS